MQNDIELQQLLKETDDVIAGLQKAVGTMMEALKPDPSYFNRITKFWTKIPVWAHVIITLFLLVPAVVLGVYINFIPMITLGVLTFISYLGLSFLVYNHHKNAIASTNGIEAGLKKSMEILGKVIHALELTCRDVAKQVNVFQITNEKLRTKVDDFTEELNAVIANAEQLKQRDKELTELVNTLELNKNIYTDAILKEQEHLAKISLDLKKFKALSIDLKAQLDNMPSEFQKVQSQVADQLKATAAINNSLKAAIDSYAKIQFPEEQKRAQFLNNLNEIINNYADHFDKIRKRLDELNGLIGQEKDKLNTVNRAYKEQLGQTMSLLARTDREINRLEQGGVQNPAEILKAKGFFVPQQLVQDDLIVMQQNVSSSQIQ
ncbi:MAG: hypothetical protein WC627_05425 [Legionella sp.]|jgi:DNA repair exonuclease SbcCD ATPase subunit